MKILMVAATFILLIVAWAASLVIIISFKEKLTNLTMT